jgi:hypothetical protein
MAGLMKMSQRVLGWDILQVYYRTYQENGTEHFRNLLQNISGAYYRARRSLLQKLIAEHIKSMLHTISGELYRAYQQHA